MDCSTPGFPVHHQLLELTQTDVHRVGDAIHPSHPLWSPSSAFNLSQHQGLFQWVISPSVLPVNTQDWSPLGWTWRRRWHPTPVLLPGKSHGQRSLVGCSPWGSLGVRHDWGLHFHFSLSCIGEGNGNPLQCFCLENPRDGGAWWAAVYGSHRVRHDWNDLAAVAGWTSWISLQSKGLSRVFFHTTVQKHQFFSTQLS